MQIEKITNACMIYTNLLAYQHNAIQLLNRVTALCDRCSVNAPHAKNMQPFQVFFRFVTTFYAHAVGLDDIAEGRVQSFFSFAEDGLKSGPPRLDNVGKVRGRHLRDSWVHLARGPVVGVRDERRPEPQNLVIHKKPEPV